MATLKTANDASILEVMGAQSGCPFHEVKQLCFTKWPSKPTIEKASSNYYNFAVSLVPQLNVTVTYFTGRILSPHQNKTANRSV